MRFHREWVEPVVPGYDSLSAFLAVVSVYLLVTVSETVLAAGLSVPVLSTIELTSVLPVPVTLVMGSVALWAIPVGYLLSDLVTGAAGTGTLVGVAVHLYLSYSAAKLVRRFDIPVAGPRSNLLRRETLSRFVLVIGVAGIGAAAVAGWTSEVVRTAPFSVAASARFVELVALNLVCALPLVGAFRSVARAVDTRFGVAWCRPSDLHGEFSSRRVALVSLAWLLVGTIGSLGYRTLERVPEYLLANRGLEVLSTLVDPELFGWGAGRLQVLVGSVLVSVLLASYLAEDPAGNGEVRL